jgi:hypothetical protein
VPVSRGVDGDDGLAQPHFGRRSQALAKAAYRVNDAAARDEQLVQRRAPRGAAAGGAAGATAAATAWATAGDTAWATAWATAWDAAWDAAGDAAGAAEWATAWDAERAWQQQRIDEVVAARGEA